MVIDKDNIKIILLILIVGLGLGYAYINSDLNINGTARVDHANWDVHWANIQVTTGSVSGANVVTQPTISNQTTVNYSIILSKPGDYYEFTVDAVNGGAIDAMIDNMEFKINGVTVVNPPAYLNYSITYSDGVPLEQNHELLANTTETYKIRIEYRTDIELNQLPTANQTLLLSSGVTYRQATDDATQRPIIRYTAMYYEYNGDESTTPRVGYAIPDTVTVYTTGADAVAAFNSFAHRNFTFYPKHIIEGGIITESYIEFIVTPEIANDSPGMKIGTYALKGGDSGVAYQVNEETLLDLYGSSNCTITSHYISCGQGGPYEFGVAGYADDSGFVAFSTGYWYCLVNENGSARYEYYD